MIGRSSLDHGMELAVGMYAGLVPVWYGATVLPPVPHACLHYTLTCCIIRIILYSVEYTDSSQYSLWQHIY